MLADKLKTLIQMPLKAIGYKVVRDVPYVYLHQYGSYEEYAAGQVLYNKAKLDQVWADESTLSAVAHRLRQHHSGSVGDVKGVCHGSRNGYEVQVLKRLLGVAQDGAIVGTDISDTAPNFPDMVQWDFHDPNPDFTDRFDFIYTNSLDQAWKPFAALETWLDQLNANGLLFIEHTRSHGVEGAGEMDPFGVLPEFMPYVLVEHFGHRISMEIIKTTKVNNNLDCWLFVLRKSN